MTDVNVDRLRELVGHLRDACRQLRELGRLGETEFLSDAKTVNSAKYLLIVATEAALDICGHVAAKRGGRSPEDYADCMRILGELGVLEEDLKIRMGKMARFRNLLVHLYWKVEDREVYRIVRERLGDFDEYLEAVGRFVESSL
ncbi:MAG: DUF86 domain-containing protein [Nitrospira sp.]|nr:DUF86 domain-containing protein [Nitrospira sp.]